MVRTFVLGLAMLAFALLAPARAQTELEGRVALVIGNAHYDSEAVPDLRNPLNDANDVARALTGYGFSVDLRTDLDKAEMTAAMADFAVKARTAEVALFYYAGHGLQVDLRNYLAPVDAVYSSHADVIDNSVPLDALTARTEDIKGALLIFLDACQENPVGGRDGLARIPVSQNQFVALAALPDARAADGAGRNSPFTEAFLANAGVPGKSISDVMLEVRLDVLAATGSQVPWDNSSLTQQVVFVPGEASVLPPETMLWRTASSMADPALLKVYLDRFPDGAHVADARMLLAQVPETGGGESDFRSTGPTGLDALEDEDDLWNLAASSRWRPLLEAYVERFPDGAHVEEAGELIVLLPDPEDPDQPATFTCERLATHPNDETAAFAGVSAARLQLNAPAAIEACRAAHAEFPQVHKYTALLARALYLGGQPQEAIELFREAADAGNIRAMTTLGAFYETGTGVPKDLAMAAGFFERAAAGGAPDAAVNLARMLAEGNGLPADLPRAIELLETASEAGSKHAPYNLGVLALNNRGLPPASALDYFALASDRGYVEGHFRAALLHESGEFGSRDPARAAEYLLRAVAADSGQMLAWIEEGEIAFGKDTITEVQRRLANIGYYASTVDGLIGPGTLEALRVYRFGGLSLPQPSSTGTAG